MTNSIAARSFAAPVIPPITPAAKVTGVGNLQKSDNTDEKAPNNLITTPNTPHSIPLIFILKKLNIYFFYKSVVFTFYCCYNSSTSL